MRLGLTEKFLAEGQPEAGKNGHVLAAVSHRYTDRPLACVIPTMHLPWRKGSGSSYMALQLHSATALISEYLPWTLRRCPLWQLQ